MKQPAIKLNARTFGSSSASTWTAPTCPAPHTTAALVKNWSKSTSVGDGTYVMATCARRRAEGGSGAGGPQSACPAAVRGAVRGAGGGRGPGGTGGRHARGGAPC